MLAGASQRKESSDAHARTPKIDADGAVTAADPLCTVRVLGAGDAPPRVLGRGYPPPGSSARAAPGTDRDDPEATELPCAPDRQGRKGQVLGAAVVQQMLDRQPVGCAAGRGGVVHPRLAAEFVGQAGWASSFGGGRDVLWDTKSTPLSTVSKGSWSASVGAPEGEEERAMSKFVDVRGTRVPAIGLGTWKLRGKNRIRVVRRALEIG